MTKRSEVEWAIELILERQEAIEYMELVLAIAENMNKDTDPATLNSIYTRLNLDNRLIYQGDNKWWVDINKVNRARKEEAKK